MVDQIDQVVDIIVPFKDYDEAAIADENKDEHDDDDDDDNDEKIINLLGYKTNTSQRPLYLIKRKKYIKLIQQQLHAKNRLLLKTFHTSSSSSSSPSSFTSYYSCEITEMQQKVLEHMTSTDAYSLIMELNETNQDDYIEKYLDQIDKHITSTLNNLLSDQLITLSQWYKMKVNRRSSKTRHNSLYFLPDTRKKNVPFYPIINDHHSSTMNIAHFLTHHLQPIYDRVTYSKTFNTSIDVIDALEEYNKKGLLRSNTQFVTIYIKNLSTILPHEQILKTLQRFLHEYIIDRRVAGIPISNIIELVRLFLENQYYRYENKLYQQIRGSHLNSPLTTILANIYMYYWQQDLVTTLNKKNEIFGRCFDNIFLTWNESEDQFYDLLLTTTMINKQRYVNIHKHMEIIINNNINYLDINISHLHGYDLQIRVAHDLINTEPYSLPYVFGHQQENFSTLLRATFIRAVRCCTDVCDFANELEDIQLSFQYNRFEPDFVIDQFKLFLQEFDVTKLELYYGEYYYDQSLYNYLRENVFNYNQWQKTVKIKHLQQQTIQYRSPHSHS